MQSVTAVARTTLLRSTVRQSTRTAVTPVRYLSSSRSTLHIPRTTSRNHKMASIVQSAAAAAHSAFATVASASQIKAGDSVPNVEIKVNDLEDKVNFSTLQGKNILVLVPGAFSGTCNSQVPGYIDRYDEFKSKGVENVYIVAVNDMFVMQAWKNKLAKDNGKETLPLLFAGDDAGKLASSLGIVFDAQAVFGGPRFMRAALVIDSGKVVHVGVEKSPGDITVSHADDIISKL
ncbi:Redoxin-domain-containing protein [Kockovaella imperatae]|uniref:Redoxin-domain-containing protein n=1 Tax=Kockovaella imperatae TaxID=4999 RepID=A0A1Y1UCT4_9TREE|nr:Redoxin-domain-containing protein [Kockovaella imperatae]ORX35334.1 Redoxin-domain-containing protein [Kockovaella imperatae]